MWNKIGFVELPRTGKAWMISHCQLPVGVSLSASIVRVFFASRTESQRSHVSYVDLKFEPPYIELVNVADQPVLCPGPIGSFDEHGVYPSSVIEYEGEVYLYYIGWNQGVEAPLFYASIGLAKGMDYQKFERVSCAPLISRSEYDPCLVTSPHVYRETDGRWRMTYVSGIKWDRDPVTGRLRSYYHIKYAEANNPLEWKRKGRIAIDLLPGERNIARPAVVKFGELDYRMWYSYVDPDIGRYRIGFARSTDGYKWVRDDSSSGIKFDCEYSDEMMCYPSTFFHQGKIFLLYNGNNYGQAGFGIAKWED